MAKQTKRQRKFQATGGVRKRIEKGSITKKGKASRKHRTSQSHGSSDTLPPTPKESIEQSRTHQSDDLLGNKHLGDLDIESFFAQFATNEPSNGENDDFEDNSDAERENIDNDDDRREDHVSSYSIASDLNEENDDRSKDEMDKSESGSGVEDEADEDFDSEDEDVEIVEARMKKQISIMQRSDPEFHDFLKENEESLLKFGNEEFDDDNDYNSIDNEDQMPQSTKSTGEGGDKSILLTPQLLKDLFRGTFQNHGLKSLKRMVAAYKSACCVSLDTSTKDSAKSRLSGESGQLYVIESKKIFDELMSTCLNSLHTEFKYHLQIGEHQAKEQEEFTVNVVENADKANSEDSNKPINPKMLEKSSQWDDMKLILQSFFRSTLRLMSEAKEPELLSFVTKNLSMYVQYSTPFPRISELILKALVGLWSAPIDTVENYQVVRVNAFLRIRQMALTQPFPFIEECLKKSYLAYMKRAKFGSTVFSSPALPTLTFMGNCLVELYGLDYHSSYQHTFVYIRQLALLLRSAMQKKTIEAMQQIYCWQYVQCLKLWVAVLCSAAQAPDGENMKSLIYPLIEIIIGTIRFIPSPVRHLPFRFHCVRLLQQLASTTSLFVPTASLLLDCFDWKEWTMAPKKAKVTNRASTRGVQLHTMLKFGKDDPLRSHDQLEAAINELFLLLHREIDLYRFSPGFPEYSIRIVVKMRKFSKEIRNPRWRTYIKACIDLCESHTAFAVSGRSKLQQAPRDVHQMECLKPSSEKSMHERYCDSVRKEQASLQTVDASTCITPTSDKQNRTGIVDHSDDEREESNRVTKSSKKKRRNPNTLSNSEEKSREAKQVVALETDQLMEAADHVKDGVVWSDDDEEMD